MRRSVKRWLASRTRSKRHGACTATRTMQRRKLALCLLGFFAVFVHVPSSDAAPKGCAIVTSTGVRFGAYDTRQNYPLDSVGVITYQCEGVNAGDTITIALNRGRSSSFQPRVMRSRNSRLEYNLYLDAARTIVWGDGSSGTSVFRTRPVEGRTTTISVFGRIPPRQNVRAGTYNDQLIMSVHF